MISAIAAISSQKRAIGNKNELLWKIPEDLKRLRAITMGHPLVMGRKTMEHVLATAGKPLGGRTNIVVTRDKNLTVDGFITTTSLDEAIEVAENSPGGKEEVFIFGGAQLFTLALPKTDRLYLTIVEDEAPADTFFPDYSKFTKVIDKSEVKEFVGIKYYYLTLEKQ